MQRSASRLINKLHRLSYGKKLALRYENHLVLLSELRCSGPPLGHCGARTFKRPAKEPAFFLSRSPAAITHLSLFLRPIIN